MRTLSEGSASGVIGVSTRTLQRWRAKGTGPEYIRVGHKIQYTDRAIKAFRSACTHVSVGTENAGDQRLEAEK
jgi:predicted site-specific integrase-resolvase